MILSLAVAVAQSGCSYRGAIRNGFSKVAAADGPGSKIPLRLGVVQSSEFMEKTFVQNGADRDITIQVQPYLADAVSAEMAKVFEAVVPLRPSEIGARAVDLLMFPSYEYRTLRSNRFFKTFTMDQELAYRFRDPERDHDIVTLRAADRLEYSQPGSARTAAIVGMASVFVLAPITIPIETNALGNHAVEVVEVSLAKMVHNLTDQVYVNRNSFTAPR